MVENSTKIKRKEKTLRILKLIYLFTDRRPHPIKNILEKLDISRATLFRYLDDIREMGIIIEQDKIGYKLSTESFFYSPQLTNDDLFLLKLAFVTYSQTTNLFGNSFLQDLQTKIFSGCPEYLQKSFCNMDKYLLKDNFSYSAQRNICISLLKALSQKKAVNVLYRKGNGDLKKYILEPHFIRYAKNRFYIISYIIEEKSWKTLRIDRFEKVSESLYTIQSRPKEDIKNKLEHSLGIEIGEIKEYRFCFTGENTINKILDKEWNVPFDIKINKEKTSAILTINTCGEHELLETILSYGSNVEVLSPPDFKSIYEEEIIKMFNKIKY